MRYYEIPQKTFDGLTTEAGILLKNFDIEAAIADSSTPGFDNSDIICATTGGIQVNTTPTYSDLGEDVDNCPLNLMELKHLDSWDVNISTTALNMDAETLKMVLGAADMNGSVVTPRMDLKLTDFTDLWWVSDKSNGGFIAAHLFNALSTSGLALQTGKNTKGQTTLELTGHVSIHKQSEVPIKFFSVTPEEAVEYTVTNNLTNVSSSSSVATVQSGESFETTLTADSGYTIDEVTVVMGLVEITGTAYNSATGKITISEVTGNVTITATAEED